MVPLWYRSAARCACDGACAVMLLREQLARFLCGAWMRSTPSETVVSAVVPKPSLQGFVLDCPVFSVSSFLPHFDSLLFTHCPYLAHSQVAIEPKTKGDSDKMTNGLVKLAQEDPSFHFRCVCGLEFRTCFSRHLCCCCWAGNFLPSAASNSQPHSGQSHQYHVAAQLFWQRSAVSAPSASPVAHHPMHLIHSTHPHATVQP